MCCQCLMRARPQTRHLVDGSSQHIHSLFFVCRTVDVMCTSWSWSLSFTDIHTRTRTHMKISRLHTHTHTHMRAPIQRHTMNFTHGQSIAATAQLCYERCNPTRKGVCVLLGIEVWVSVRFCASVYVQTIRYEIKKKLFFLTRIGCLSMYNDQERIVFDK